jgi:hypothetical protein
VNIYDVSVKQLKRAAAIKEQIERWNRELSALLGEPVTARATLRTTRTMSLSVKKKIAAAQRARWANLRRAKPSTRSVKPAAKTKKKTMSPAARKNLSAKLKAYWAQKKANKK